MFDADFRKMLTRRSFLRGCGVLTAAASVGIASSRSLLGQEDTGQKNQEQPEPPADAEPAPPPETKYDERGAYRLCPACRSKMYNYPAHTWTCENCGYFYTE